MTRRRPTDSTPSTRIAGVLVVLMFAAIAGFGAVQASALGAIPYWRLESRPAPTNLPLNGEGEIVATLANLGSGVVRGENQELKVTDTLPEGVEATAVMAQSEPSVPGANKRLAGLVEGVPNPNGWRCSKLTARSIECNFGEALPPYQQLEIWIHVKTHVAAPTDELSNDLTVEGGGAGQASLSEPLKINGLPTSFGVEKFQMTPEGQDGEVDLQAGSHPYQLTTTFDLNQAFIPQYRDGSEGGPAAPALERNLHFELPAGLIGNATVAPQCSAVDFGAFDEKDINSCPDDTAVGVAAATFYDPVTLGYTTFVVPVFNLVPPPGEPAQFGFSPNHVPIVLNTAVRTGGNYGVTVSVEETSEAVQVLGSRVTFWGVPGDQSHEQARGWDCLNEGGFVEKLANRSCPKIEDPTPPPFLMLPTACESLQTFVNGEAWNGEKISGKEEGFSGVPSLGSEASPAVEGCEGLTYNPSIEVKPDQHSASTPSGLTVEVNVPQEGTLTATDLANADIKQTRLALPEGLQASAGAANLLQTCSVGAAGFDGLDSDTGEALETELAGQAFTSAQAACPEASKIGTVEIETPLLAHKLEGGVYLAAQDTDPFASPLVIYMVAEEEPNRPNKTEPRVLTKLAGEVSINQTTGQLVSTFKKTPQAPFEHLRIHLFDGPTSAQATPTRCGLYHAVADFSSWSNEQPTVRESNPENPGGFDISSGPNGTSCPGSGQLPFAPSFEAGSSNSQGGAFTPFTLTIKRADGGQALKGIDMETPPGLAAVLASVPLCGEPQAADGNCGPESEIGQSVSSSGLGSSPINLPGKVYLTGPYNGAPFGLSAVTEVVTGPFHVGKVVVRSSIDVNPTTAQAIIDTDNSTFFSDSGEVQHFAGLPEIIKGVPAQIKELNVTIDRPGFEFNPTNCSKLETTGTLKGSESSTGVSSQFYASGCASLPFVPKLTASVEGQGSKEDGTEFDVTIQSPGLGQANIHKVDLTIPALLPSRLTTIQKACLEATFNANPASCDGGSVIGEGVVETPVFKDPLRGPAYLVSHGAAAFPDVEFVLQGEGEAKGVEVILDGKTDIKNKVTYSRFETSPDAPFTKFVSRFPAGPHSALTPNVPETEHYNLCKHTLTVPTEITGQNGAFISQTTPVTILGCHGVEPSKVKKLSRAQQLAKALKACKKDKKKSKRVACEKSAHKKYGPKKPAKKRSSKKK
jgi:hypothetical protein